MECVSGGKAHLEFNEMTRGKKRLWKMKRKQKKSPKWMNCSTECCCVLRKMFDDKKQSKNWPFMLNRLKEVHSMTSDRKSQSAISIA